MNYYEHHIGDWAQATAHLSFVEEAAYSRLVRKCYATESPLPADIKHLQRLVGARTNQERRAVLAVLAEFWTLQEDGYHNARCDAEIARYLEAEPERQLRKANEKNRTDRHREERARLFRALTDAGQHAPWNIPVSELRELVRAITATAPATPATPAATAPATAPATPATATQYPLPTTHLPKKENPPASRVPPTASPRPSRKCPPGFELTAELRDWARANAPNVDVELETAKFRDHTFAASKSDWMGTWRNWVRRAQGTGPHSAAKGPSFRERDEAAKKAVVDEWMGSANPRNIIDMEPADARIELG